MNVIVFSIFHSSRGLGDKYFCKHLALVTMDKMWNMWATKWKHVDIIDIDKND